MLTANKINQLQPSAQAFEITDSPGLAVRVSPGGTKSWRVHWCEGGRVRRRTVGHWPAMSAPAARAERDRIRGGTAGALTVAQFARTYIATRSRPYKRSWRFDQRLLEQYVLPVIGSRPLPALRRADCMRVVDVLRERGRPDLASRVYRCLRAVLYHAMDRELLAANPAARMLVPQSRPRDRTLTSAELQAWFRALRGADVPHAARGVLLFQLASGARLAEVVGLEDAELDDVDDAWRLPAARSKTAVARVLPLSPLLRALVEDARARRPGAGRVFPVGIDTVRTWMRRTIERAGLAPARCHDLRRTARTGFAAAGVSEVVAELVLGHQRKGVAGVYDQHEYRDEMHAALTAWGEKLTAIADHELTTPSPKAAQTKAHRHDPSSPLDEHAPRGREA